MSPLIPSDSISGPGFEVSPLTAFLQIGTVRIKMHIITGKLPLALRLNWLLGQEKSKRLALLVERRKHCTCPVCLCIRYHALHYNWSSNLGGSKWHQYLKLGNLSLQLWTLFQLWPPKLELQLYETISSMKENSSTWQFQENHRRRAADLKLKSVPWL